MINVDKIVTISLKENTSRREETQVQLAKLNIKTDYYLAERDTGHEERGCFNSHVAVAKQALSEGHEQILIFEDDVRIGKFTTDQIETINHFLMQQKTPFDVLYLGLILGKMWFTRHRGIAGAKGAGLHSYILSKTGMEKLASRVYDGEPIDKVIKHDFNCFSIYPMITDQYPETVVASDISPTRDKVAQKTEAFWQENAEKQRWLRWKNLHKADFRFLLCQR